MNTKLMRYLRTTGISIAGAALFAACAENAPVTGQPRVGSSQSAGASDPSPSESKKESVRPPVRPAPAESKTPEEAAARAADPKDPSGALIVLPPAGKDSPRKPQ